MSQVNIGVRGWLRWGWRQLTSMKVAIILLLILTVAIIPASILPQRSRDAAAVSTFLENNGTWGTILDALGFFNLFTAPWFAAIYILLFVALVGCVVPRSIQLVADWKAGPGRIPTNLSRLDHETAQVDGDDEAILARAEAALKRYRVVRRDGGISAENGYVRQAANLIFHLALLGLLITLALGQVVSYRGQAIIVEKGSFVNSVLGYDTFSQGSYFRGELKPYIMTLDKMNPSFNEDGTPSAFSADLTISEDGQTRSERVSPNYPVEVDGSNIYLSGNGYAPNVTVRDSSGEVAFEGNVVLPDITSDYISRGVIKVPDTADRDKQLGMQATLYPTAVEQEGAISSAFPDALNPVLVVLTWHGDLGLDEGVPENVYTLNTDNLILSRDPSGLATTTILHMGETLDLPDGLGTITFNSLERFAALDIRHDPTLMWLFVFAAGAFGGIALSLLLPQRRIFVRPGEGTVTVAGIGRPNDSGLTQEISATLKAIKEDA